MLLNLIRGFETVVTHCVRKRLAERQAVLLLDAWMLE